MYRQTNAESPNRRPTGEKLALNIFRGKKITKLSIYHEDQSQVKVESRINIIKELHVALNAETASSRCTSPHVCKTLDERSPNKTLLRGSLQLRGTDPFITK